MTCFIRNRLLQAGSVFAAALLAAGAAAPVQAAPGEKAAATSQAKPEARKDRPICVYVELTGTRVPRRVCRTALEWQRDGGVPTND